MLCYYYYYYYYYCQDAFRFAISIIHCLRGSFLDMVYHYYYHYHYHY